jgi:hypothetical protein
MPEEQGTRPEETAITLAAVAVVRAEQVQRLLVMFTLPEVVPVELSGALLTVPEGMVLIRRREQTPQQTLAEAGLELHLAAVRVWWSLGI